MPGSKNRREDMQSQSGQILLITLLVLSVAVTIVLSFVGRVTTDVSISNQAAESMRAFNAAEAGLEETLKLGTTGTYVLTPDTKYTVNKDEIGGQAGTYIFPSTTKKGSVETLWLVNHDANGALIITPTYTAANRIDVCWSSESITPSVVVTILTKKSGGSYQVARGAYDPDNTRAGTNNFTNPVTDSSGGCGANTGTTYRERIKFSDFSIDETIDTVIALRILPLYSDTKIAIKTTVAIPVQGYRVQSQGTTSSGVTRKILVFQPFRAPAAIFDYVIYSQGSFRH